MLTAVLALTLCQVAGLNGYPMQTGRCYMDVCGARLDGLSIVRLIGQPTRSRRQMTSSGRPGPAGFSVQGARVVDPRGFARGTLVKIVTPVLIGAVPAMSPDASYLLVAEKVHDGTLGVPGDASFDDDTFPAESSNEVSGLAIFETKQAKLSTGQSPADRVATSIADCLEGASDEGVRRVLAFFYNARYPGYEGRKMVFGQVDFPLSLRMRELAAHASPYQRARILLTLNEWKVFGSADAYNEALHVCAADPTAFNNPPEEIKEPVFYEEMFGRNVPNGFRHTVVTPNRWADIVTTAKNRRVQLFLVSRASGKPDEGHLKRLAALFNDPDPSVGRRLAGFYAWCYKEPEHAPREVKLPDGTKTYPNLSEVVGYWRARFNVQPPPR